MGASEGELSAPATGVGTGLSEDGEIVLDKSQASGPISLILGPGGLRAYGHVGFVQELIKAGVSIESISGIESGALVAALVAFKGQAFDVEWQMLKLKESDWLDTGFLSQKIKPKEGESWFQFLSPLFGKTDLSQFKISYFCPSLALDSGRAVVFRRGPAAENIAKCVGSYPLNSPYSGHSAFLFSAPLLAKRLREAGAKRILYVSLLSSSEDPSKERDKANQLGPRAQLFPHQSEDSYWWNQVALFGQTGWGPKTSSLDRMDRVAIPLQDISLNDFSKRDEMIRRGKILGARIAEMILRGKTNLNKGP